METGPLLQLLPLVLLIVVAVYLVTRGSRTKPDADSNKPDIGGGSGGSQFPD
ncbi:MAG: hypothetical protein WBV62_06510 [Roseobacter sp.]